MIKLSIAIPTYNRASFLIETLSHITPQLQNEVEIVVSDNGSTDETLEVLKEYQKSFQVRVVGFKSNQGIDHNIVHVLEQSRGEYVHFFGDDDLLMPSTISLLLKEIEETNPLIICLNHFAFKNHQIKDKQPPFLSRKRKVFHSGEAFFQYCGLGFLSSLVVKRKEVKKFIAYVRFGKECAHLDMLTRLALKNRGPYIFRGDISVAGRALTNARYDLMSSCVLYPQELYNELFQEKLLSSSSYKMFLRRLLYKEIPRIYYKLIKKENVDSLYEIKKHFSDLKGSSLFLSMLEKMNTNFGCLIFDLIFWMICIYRKIKLLFRKFIINED